MKLIRDALDELNSKLNINAAMPGHKGRIQIDVKNDFTELEGLDNLQSPKEVIFNSQNLGKDVYGVNGFRYIVNGSTCANLTMIFSYINENECVLVERNCHKSIFNGLMLRHSNPIFMYRDDYERPLDGESILKYIEENKEENIKAVIVTNPSYLGFIEDYKDLYFILQKMGIKLLVDGAHGAHLISFNKFHGYYKYMDAMSISLHKSLGCINQSAALLFNDDKYLKIVESNSNIFQSSSPSYLMLSNMEEALLNIKDGFYNWDIKEEFEKISLNIENKKYRLIGNDPYKLCINSNNNGQYIYESLIKYGIYPEMYNNDNVLLMLSPYNTREELLKISEIIEKINLTLSKDNKNHGKIGYPKGIKIYNPHEMIGLEGQKIKYKDAIGKVSVNMITPYPPGIPLLIGGELISEEIVNTIEKLKSDRIEINGLCCENDEYIEVIDNDR